MGTNYYLHQEPCPHCKHQPEPLHIGKSSGGWCFSLHVIPELGLNSLEDWKELCQDQYTYTIKDEYGYIISLQKLLGIITERSQKRVPQDNFDFERNYAEPGPNGLVRSKIDGERCLGHGEGTWDYIIGDFS